MKKCSSSSHHAMAELNITPLLDLAFVLLVIFIITTTPVVNDLDVDLPSAAKREKDPKPKVNYITIESSGRMFLNKDEVADLSALYAKLMEKRMGEESNMNVVIRGSGRAKYSKIVAVMDTLQDATVLKVNLATEPLPDGPKAKE